ncbi:MAG TPA: peptidoglycan-binding protein, partial [Steroidobacteraceae bacterium]
VRLLTNLETNTQKLLQIILIGQPELRELLGRTELRQLAQRITGRYHLDPLSREETSAYVLHRLRVAGATTDIFTTGSLKEIYRLSGGVPRVINVIADRALLGAYTLDRHKVTSQLVRAAAGEVFGRRFAPHWVPWAGIAALGVALVTGTWAAWEFGLPISGSSEAVASTPSAAQDAEKETPQTAANSKEAGEGAKPEAQPLAALLTQYKSETGPDGAFTKLFRIWGAKYVAGKVDPCSQAVRQGLECLMQRGSFGQLRLYNRPAILLLNDDNGEAWQVVLTALSDELAQIDLGGARHDVKITELSQYWLGDFVLLWRPDTGRVKPLSVGMRGDDVRWLRENLHRWRGEEPAEPVSDVFDAELSELVMDFQRRHRLTVDGIAGVQTQLVLASAVAPPDSPLLRTQSTHGS